MYVLYLTNMNQFKFKSTKNTYLNDCNHINFAQVLVVLHNIHTAHTHTCKESCKMNDYFIIIDLPFLEIHFGGLYL